MNHSLMLAATIKPQAHESFLVQQFLKNCCTEKLFSRLRLVAYSHFYYFKNSRSCDSNSARTAP